MRRPTEKQQQAIVRLRENPLFAEYFLGWIDESLANEVDRLISEPTGECAGRCQVLRELKQQITGARDARDAGSQERTPDTA